MTCTCINQRSVKRVTCHSRLSESVWMWSSQDEGVREKENIHNATHWHTPLCQTTNPHVGFFCCGVGNCTYRGGSPRTTRVSLSGHQRALMSAPRLLFAALNNEKLETMAACLHIMYSNIYIFTPKPHTHRCMCASMYVNTLLLFTAGIWVECVIIYVWQLCSLQWRPWLRGHGSFNDGRSLR